MLIKYESLPRTSNLKTSRPVEPTTTEKLRTPRLCSLRLRPPAHAAINSLLKKRQKAAFKKAAAALGRQGLWDYIHT